MLARCCCELAVPGTRLDDDQHSPVSRTPISLKLRRIHVRPAWLFGI